MAAAADHNGEHLKDYWSHGKGAAKIGWGTPGDFNRCVVELGKYLPPEEVKGYCALRHHEAIGAWPGQEKVDGTTKDAAAKMRGKK